MSHLTRPIVLAVLAFAGLTGCPGDDKHDATTESHVPVAAASVGAATSPGQTVFQNRCQSCHGVFGAGGMGPSLVKAGTRLNDASIEITIKQGRPAKGMPGFEGVLTVTDIEAVKAYVKTL